MPGDYILPTRGIGHIWQQLGTFAQRDGDQRDKSEASGGPKEGGHDSGYFSSRFVKTFWAERHRHSLHCWESGNGLSPWPPAHPTPASPCSRGDKAPVGPWDRESTIFALLSCRMANIPAQTWHSIASPPSTQDAPQKGRPPYHLSGDLGPGLPGTQREYG